MWRSDHNLEISQLDRKPQFPYSKRSKYFKCEQRKWYRFSESKRKEKLNRKNMKSWIISRILLVLAHIVIQCKISIERFFFHFIFFFLYLSFDRNYIFAKKKCYVIQLQLQIYWVSVQLLEFIFVFRLFLCHWKYVAPRAPLTHARLLNYISFFNQTTYYT